MSESGQMEPGDSRLHPGSTPGQSDATGAGTGPAKRKRSRKRRRPKGAAGAPAGGSGQGAARTAGDRDAGANAVGAPPPGGVNGKAASAGSRKRARKRHRPNRAERRADASRTDTSQTDASRTDASRTAASRAEGQTPAETAGQAEPATRAQTAPQAGRAAIRYKEQPQAGARDAAALRRGVPTTGQQAGWGAGQSGPGSHGEGSGKHDRPVEPVRAPVPHCASGLPARGRDEPVAHRPPPHGHAVAGPEAEPPGRLYAALDLGTNNCRLLVARPEQRGFRVVDAYSRIVRLGEGLGHTNRLSEPAMERALEALVCCRDKLEERGVDRFRLIATEACRAAENGPQFIERVRQETGLALEIASRETEARLAVAGCASLVCPDANGVVLFDIGGGSSEIVWLDLRNRCGARGVALTRFIRAWISLPVGVVNLAERHGGRHVTTDTFEAMVNDARAHLEAFSLGRELSAAICDGKVHMLGTSGTVTTLAGVHFGLKRYDRRRVDGAWMDTEDVSAMIERLRAMPYEERVDNPCIGADRADLVLAGCAILEAIRRRWPCQRLRVADRGLREGILMELMAADNVWRRKPPHRQRPRGRTR